MHCTLESRFLTAFGMTMIPAPRVYRAAPESPKRAKTRKQNGDGMLAKGIIPVSPFSRFRLFWAFAIKLPSEIPFEFFLLHGAVLVVVDEARDALRMPRDHHLLHDLLNRSSF